jgi:hypothetical protein
MELFGVQFLEFVNQFSLSNDMSTSRLFSAHYRESNKVGGGSGSFCK